MSIFWLFGWFLERMCNTDVVMTWTLPLIIVAFTWIWYGPKDHVESPLLDKVKSSKKSRRETTPAQKIRAPEAERKEQVVKAESIRTVHSIDTQHGRICVTKVTRANSRGTILTYHDYGTFAACGIHSYWLTVLPSGVNHRHSFNGFFQSLEGDAFFDQFSLVHVDAPFHEADSKPQACEVPCLDCSHPSPNYRMLYPVPELSLYATTRRTASRRSN